TSSRYAFPFPLQGFASFIYLKRNILSFPSMLTDLSLSGWLFFKTCFALSARYLKTV
ncbi:mCG1031052, partial [Mus musculus]